MNAQEARAAAAWFRRNGATPLSAVMLCGEADRLDRLAMTGGQVLYEHMRSNNGNPYGYQGAPWQDIGSLDRIKWERCYVAAVTHLQAQTDDLHDQVAAARKVTS